MNNEIASILRKKNRHSWLVFGAFFLLVTYHWGGQNGTFHPAPVLVLFLLYFLLGQAAATLIAYFTKQADYDPTLPFAETMYLAMPTIKGGMIAALISFLLHFGILWLGEHSSWIWLPQFRSEIIVIIASLIFPLMACLSASGMAREDIG